MTATADLAKGLAALHAEAFDAPWDAAAFADLMGQIGVALDGNDDGFILVRTVADEAEILTLAVRPGARRRGIGARLVETAARRAATSGATRVFLEVAEDNVPARGLYGRLGFEAAGRRPRYYPRADGSAVAALILVLNLG